MRKDLVVEDEEPVVEPVGDVEEEEANEDEAEAEHQQLHPCLVLKVELEMVIQIGEVTGIHAHLPSEITPVMQKMTER